MAPGTKHDLPQMALVQVPITQTPTKSSRALLEWDSALLAKVVKEQATDQDQATTTLQDSSTQATSEVATLSART